MNIEKKLPYWVSNRNQAVKAIKKNLPVWVNTWSTDCDGCSSQGSARITSVQQIVDFEKDFENALNWADGPMGYTYVFNASEALENHTSGYWGM